MRVEEIAEKALRIVKPSKLEEKRFGRIVDEALKTARELAENAPGVVDVTLEGSAAKNTWVRGRAEADIFIHFDPETSREELEKRIVELGTELIEKLGGEPMLMYADHPYVEGVIKGVTIDVVACYRVEPRKWIGATDRTPY
ncbi:MAG TPA: CCA-adding protein, partial [Nitrososphaeria archaeon]|nr:CCA-adding protein [Nitrososphaeria archaeon]